MASLGKCLVFRLKYHPDMQSVSENVPNRKEMERILKMVGAVHARAEREGIDFLQACHRRLEHHLDAIGQFKRPKGRWNDWYLLYVSANGMEAGVWIDEKICSIIPWFWRSVHGDGDLEAKIESILELPPDPLIKRRFREMGWLLGMVALARIKVPFPERTQDFEVDREGLLTSVENAFRVLTPEAIKKIGEIA